MTKDWTLLKAMDRDSIQVRRRAKEFQRLAHAAKRYTDGDRDNGPDSGPNDEKGQQGETPSRSTLSSVFSYGTRMPWGRSATGILEPGRAQPTPYTCYLLNAVKNLFLTFYFNWTMLFTAPLSSAMFLLVYPSSVLFLLVFEIGLRVFMESLGGQELSRHISLRFGKGLSAINWGAPQLLLSDATCHLVQATIPSMGAPVPLPTPSPVYTIRQRTFDLSIAQTCVVLAALVYERDTNMVKEAYEVASSDGLWDEQGNDNDEVQMRVRQLLWDSEARIRAIAAKWGLEFTGVSELKSLGGPFCGIFWSTKSPFIVVAFKGTTPTNYEEFLVDATFQRTDARPFLFGGVHEGFYESVFATSAFGDQDIRDPYGSILAAVDEKARELSEELDGARVQVWITGHSLGAAMSSLLFARWLKCPEDLAPHIDLRDCYVIGTPAVGDTDFASTFASYTTSPITRSSTLWRLMNKSDLFCHLPPGYDSRTIGHYMSQYDFFNYSHVGHAIQLTHRWHTKPLKMYPSSYQPTMQVNIVVGACRDMDLDVLHRKEVKDECEETQDMDAVTRGGVSEESELPPLPRWATHPCIQQYLLPRLSHAKNPIHVLEKLYPFFIQDHIPAHYFHGLQRARAYYRNAEHTVPSNKVD